MSNRAISIVSGAAFILAASGSAFAADMPVKAPAPAPAPVWNWTGWYAGVNAGASMGSAQTNFNEGPVVVTRVDNGVTVTNTPFSFSDRGAPDGFMGGGQIGYNWQYSPLIVVGLEADIQGALERDSENLTNSFSGTGVFSNGFKSPFTATVLTDYTTKIDWFGTVRGRIGYVWGNGNVLTYLTGGFAYGRVGVEGTNTINGMQNNGPGFTISYSVTQAFDQSHVNTGWVAGYGTEGRLGNSNWTWKVEGLYMDLGHLDTTGVTTGASASALNGGCGPLCTASGGQVATNTHFTDWILRGGLNYQFH